ncbi:MAG: YqgE/AlgH family protein, partial [Candidatus Methylomirabilis sp.]|nr:YqgE/AlgH family protein [Deltaproteobacteria bacterium]
CQHDADGAMGLILNRPSEYTLGDVLEQMGIAGGDPVLLGERVGAREALAMGLVTEVHPKAELEARARALAETLAGLPPAAMGLAKEAMHALGDMEYFASLGYLREMITIQASTEDAAEGIRAFFEKRAPVWKGR